MFQVTACEHIFCKACLIDFSASLGQVSCPSCSKLLTVDLTTSPDAGNQTTKTTIKGFRSSSILNRIQLENFQTSTKIEALVCQLILHMQHFLFFLPYYIIERVIENGLILDQWLGGSVEFGSLLKVIQG